MEGDKWKSVRVKSIIKQFKALSIVMIAV